MLHSIKLFCDTVHKRMMFIILHNIIGYPTWRVEFKQIYNQEEDDNEDEKGQKAKANWAAKRITKKMIFIKFDRFHH